MFATITVTCTALCCNYTKRAIGNSTIQLLNEHKLYERQHSLLPVPDNLIAILYAAGFKNEPFSLGTLIFVLVHYAKLTTVS